MISIQKLQANTNAFVKAKTVNAKVYRRANNFQVAGNGDIYEVSMSGDGISCTCKAAQFDRACYHAAAVFTLIDDERFEAFMIAYSAEYSVQDAARREAEAVEKEAQAAIEAAVDKEEADALFYNSLTAEQESEYCDALVAAHEQWEPGYDRPRCVNFIN